MNQRKRKVVLLCSVNSLAMRVEAHAMQTVIPSGDDWLCSSWTPHRQFYHNLVFSQGKRKQQKTQTPQNPYKLANVKQDMTSVVLLPRNWAISQCHVNGRVWQRRLFAGASSLCSRNSWHGDDRPKATHLHPCPLWELTSLSLLDLGDSLPLKG